MPSYIPSYNVQKVLVGQARMFVAPYIPSAPEPLPANTVALGAAWGVNWVPVGATEDGMQFNFQRSTEKIMIEEQVTAVYRNTTEVDWNIEATLSEDSLETMKLAMGGGTIVVTPPASGIPGTRKLTISTDLEQLTFGFEGQNYLGQWRRVRIPLVTSEGNVAARYRRAADARRYKTQFNALCAPESVDIIEWNAAALP